MTQNKNQGIKAIYLVLIVMSLLVLVCSLPATFAANQTVDQSATPSGTVQNNISSAITNANNGDTITINPGKYQGSGNNTNILIEKNLTIKGNGPAKDIIIDGQGLYRIFRIGNNINITFSNITFTNAYFNGNGGAIWSNNENTRMTFISCIFTNNRGANGAAIYNKGHNLNITDSTFKNNTGTTTAGAISNDNANNLSITNSNFIENSGNSGGAIHNNRGNNSNVVNCTFDSNNVTGYGGAIYSQYASGVNFNIVNSTFKNNKANYAGAIYGIASLININNSTFLGNNATNSGGAILDRGGLVNINNSVFKNNKANNGGALANEVNGGIIIANSNFTENDATSNGGAIYNSRGSIEIQGSNIINNTKGIFISSASADAVINYNRIFNNTDYDLENSGAVVDADYNWWGSNNPDITKIIGVTLNNYFVMKVVNTTSLESNGTVRFSYTFVLNTGTAANNNLLPYFITSVSTDLAGDAGSFDARFNKNFDVNLKSNGNVIYTFITDDEVQSLSGTVEIIEDEVNDGKQGEIVDPNANPENPSIPDVNPESNDHPTAKAHMKKTGIPMNLILLVILSILGILVTKKQNKTLFKRKI